MKSPFLRILLLLAWLPAIGLAFLLSMWGLLENGSPLIASVRPLLTGFFSRQMLENPQHFRFEAWTLCFHRFLEIELYVSMVVILLVGPSLISQDLRFNALPLYFSRPLRRIDYFVGKLGVVAWFIGMVVVVPALLAYILGLLFSLDVTIVRDTLPVLLACLAYGAVIVLSAGTLMLALSSLSRNSRYVALFWVALWFVTMIVGGILTQVDVEQRRFKRREIPALAVQQPGDKLLSPAEQLAQQRAMQAGPKDERAIPGGRIEGSPGQLETNGVLHRQLVARRRVAVWHRHHLARAKPARTGPGAGKLSAPASWSAISLVLVRQRAFSSFWTFRMHSELPGPVPGPAEVKPIVEFHEVSKWYGNVIGVNKLSLRVPAGVTGLLGPNGAGKSTLLQLATGQLRPSQGTVRVLGQHRVEQSIPQSPHRLMPGTGRILRMDDRPGLRADLCPAFWNGPGRGERGSRARTLEAVGMTPNQRPGDARLFQGHAPAHQAGPGVGSRPRRSLPR